MLLLLGFFIWLLGFAPKSNFFTIAKKLLATLSLLFGPQGLDANMWFSHVTEVKSATVSFVRVILCSGHDIHVEWAEQYCKCFALLLKLVRHESPHLHSTFSPPVHLDAHPVAKVLAHLSLVSLCIDCKSSKSQKICCAVHAFPFAVLQSCLNCRLH